MTHPTLKEELDRKSFATVEWLYSSLERGRITPSQFSTGLDALFMAVSGLTNDGVIDLITAGSGAASKEVAKIRRVLLKGDSTMVLTWVAGSELFEATSYRSGVKRGTQTTPLESPAKAKLALDSAAQHLLARGYMEA